MRQRTLTERIEKMERDYMEYTLQAKREIELLFSRYPQWENSRAGILRALEALIQCYQQGGKVLICGNGGSAADCEHIVGELMKGFKKLRPIGGEKLEALKTLYPEEYQRIAAKLQDGLPAISLVSHSALITAFLNDVDPDYVYAQQVIGYGKRGDLLIGISTSGNAENVNNGVKVAKALGLFTLGLTGKTGGKMKDLCDETLIAPAQETYAVQELHLPLYHMLCAACEAQMFTE